jgi:PAS domain S-box-containing protein
MQDTPLYNSRLVRNYVEYLRKFYPQIDPTDVMEYAGIEPFEIEESGVWFTQRQIDRFHEMLSQLTDNPNLSREVGRFSVMGSSLSPIRRYILGFLSPFMSYTLAEKAASKITLASSYKIKKMGGRKVEIVVELKEGLKENPFQCENRIGMIEVVAKLYTKKLARVDHPLCIHQGGPYCRYLVSWERTPALVWNTIKKFGLVLFLLLGAGSFFLMPSYSSWLSFLGKSLLAYLGIMIFSGYVEKKELVENITKESESTQSLLNQTNRRYNEVLLIKEIGQTLSMILDIDVSLQAIMEAMKKRLDFDRGMIMLADKEKTKLRFVTGFGYDPADETYIKTIEFHLDNPQSTGIVVESFRKQAPFMINNAEEVSKKISPRSLEFLRRMGSQSFICVPIVFKKEPLGILLVDNLTSKRPLTKGDLSLLMGIAPQIAINITNASTYKKIQESEERFRSLSENTPDIIYALDREGFFSYVNPAWERILGFPPNEVIGKKFIDFLKSGEGPKFQQLFDQVWEEKQIIPDTPGTFLSKEGQERIFSASGGPHFDAEGKVAGLVGILKDITEQTVLENRLRQAKKMEAIGTLAGGIAHDFNNLLMGIQGYTSLLLLKIDETHPFYEKLSGISQQVQSGVDLTKQLLGFARGGKYEVRPVDLNQILRQSSDMFGRTRREVRIERLLQEDLWTVEVDKGQIEQALLNLYVNAWQAMPQGGSLILETRNIFLTAPGPYQLQPGKYVKISITDTGEGMEEGIIERIFEPFFTTKEMGRGTGLGLAMVYGIVKSHGGSIFAQSEKGRGTSFSIYLPASDKQVIEKGAPAPKALRGHETILLIDDEEVVLTVTGELLENLGYRVLPTNNGLEGISLFRSRQEEISLVILDMIMPDIKGSEIFDNLKEIDPKVKVLLSSGYSIDGQASQLIEKGCKAFIQKPYTVSELSQKVRAVLEMA